MTSLPPLAYRWGFFLVERFEKPPIAPPTDLYINVIRSFFTKHFRSTNMGSLPESAAADQHQKNGTSTQYPIHPLGPLSAEEISRSANLIRGAWPEGTKFQFKVITLSEPAKVQLIPYLDAEKKGQATSPIDRRSFVGYYIRNTVRKGHYLDRTRQQRSCLLTLVFFFFLKTVFGGE